MDERVLMNEKTRTDERIRTDEEILMNEKARTDEEIRTDAPWNGAYKGGNAWFQAAALPVLEEFADMSGASLSADSGKPDMDVVTMVCADGFDITEACHALKSILLMANNIRISADKGKVVLTLYFSRADMPD